MVDYTAHQIAEGKKLLKNLKNKAKKEAEKDLLNTKSYLQPQTLIGQRTLENIKEKNLEALVIHSKNTTDWYADILLKNTPVGVPNVLGTPTHHPEKSEKEAIKSGYIILVSIYKNILFSNKSTSDTKRKNERVFSLYGVDISIPGAVIEEIHKSISNISEEFFPSEEFLITKLQAIIKDKILTAEKIDSADKKWQLELYNIITLLLITGIFKYPYEYNS